MRWENLPFLRRWRRRNVVGMDIGTSSIKWVRLQRKNGSWEGISQWFYPSPLPSPGEGGEAVRSLRALREFLRANSLAGSCVACSVEDPSLKIHKVDLPKMPEADLREAIRWQLRDVVEGPVSEYVVRHSLLEETVAGDTTRLTLLAYAIKKEPIRRLLGVLKEVSLQPVAVEPAAASLLAAFDQIHGWKAGECYGLIDFGEGRALFVVVGEGRLFFSRLLTGISGRHLGEVLARELGLAPADAEEVKGSLMGARLSGVRCESAIERAQALLPSFYTRLAVEVQRSIDAFLLMFRREKAHHLFLCGGGAALPGLEEYLTKNVAIPASLLNPATRFPISAARPYLYDVALGLALYS